MCDGEAKQKGKSEYSEAVLQERMLGQHDLTSTTVPSFQTRPQHGGLVWVDKTGEPDYGGQLGPEMHPRQGCRGGIGGFAWPPRLELEAFPVNEW